MHIRRNWEPRMRRELLAAAEAGAPNLKDLMRDALGAFGAALS